MNSPYAVEEAEEAELFDPVDAPLWDDEPSAYVEAREWAGEGPLVWR